MSRFDLLFRAPKKPESNGRYDGGEAHTKVLPLGYQRSPDARTFKVSTVYEKDVKIPLRDGVVLRADVFRPEDSQRVPAILPWSPYGKSGRGEIRANHGLNKDLRSEHVHLDRATVDGFAW